MNLLKRGTLVVLLGFTVSLPAQERRDRAAFQPQNEREAALYRMIQQLQAEVGALRRQLGGDSARDRDEAYRARVTDRPAESYDRRAAQNDALRRKTLRIFAAYDKNKDGTASFEEWLAMREGEMTDERRARERTFFAEPAGEDGKITAEEFYAWTLRRQNGNARREGAQRRPESDARRDGDPRREGDAPKQREVRRDGERREGDAPRERDVRRDSDVPREGDAPRQRDVRRDGDRREGDAPREGDERRDR